MRIERRLGQLYLWAKRAAAAAAGALSVLSMAPFHLWPVLWLTLPVLCLLADDAAKACRPRTRFAPWQQLVAGRAAEIGWWFGFAYFLAGLFWVGEAFLVEAEVFAWLLPFAMTLLPAGLALFSAAAAGSMHLVPGWSPIQRAVALSVGLGITEWLRGHILTGFPWNVFGYALTAPLALLQSVSVFGIYGLTVIAVLIFAVPFALLRGRDGVPSSRPRHLWMALAVAVLPLLLMGLYGNSRLARVPLAAPDLTRPKVRLLQLSIPQLERMQPANQRAIFDRHLAQSLTGPDGVIDNATGVDLIIWPEAAMPFVPLSQPVALADIGRMLPAGTLLLSGALRVEPGATPLGRKVYNSVLLFNGGETAPLLATYDKVHLVPFGEYLPAQSLLEAIGLEQITRQRGGFAAGALSQRVMSIGGLGRVMPLICYEAIFPLAPLSAADRPDLLMTITNDSWFGDTTGPRQHYAQARVRAVEMGVPMIRASSNGISALLDGYGREMGRLDLNAVGSLDVRVPAAVATTPYGQFGDKIFFGIVIALIMVLTKAARKG